MTSNVLYFLVTGPYMVFANRLFVQRMNLDGTRLQALYAGLTDNVTSYVGLDLDMR